LRFNIAEKDTRINREITGTDVRLLGPEGEQLGIVSVREALFKAEEAELDLVEIAPLAEPPVCRIMDFGKFKYKLSKQQHEAKLKQKIIEIKEVLFRPGTDDNDYERKLRMIRGFLEEGDKIKCRLRFRGREMAHQEFGIRQLQRVREDLADVVVVEQFPKMEGRQMIMILAPKKKIEPVKEKPAKPAGEAVAKPATPKPAAAKPAVAAAEASTVEAPAVAAPPPAVEAPKA
jgi:translation initiation factor IF-3